MIKLFIFFLLCQTCFASQIIRGYEVVADNSVVKDIKKDDFVCNVGKKLSRAIVLQDVQKFQDYGTIKLVKFGTKPYKNGIKLRYKVKANDKIKSIYISGIQALTQKDILPHFNSKIGDILNYRTLFLDTNKISKLYLQHDILYVDVLKRTDVSTQNGKIIIKVTEFKMGKLVITGASGKIAAEIKNKFKLKPGQLMYRRKFLDSLYDMLDIPGIVDLDWDPVFNKKTVDIVIKIK